MIESSTKIIHLRPPDTQILNAEDKKLVHLIASIAVSNTKKKGNYDQKSHQVPENISRQAKQL